MFMEKSAKIKGKRKKRRRKIKMTGKRRRAN